nr:xylulose kinase-1 [Tanacetum cinerariifolium]
MSLTFADTHNMVAYLTKSDASEGFNQVIDFLNGSHIKYALTVNLNIYVSCIKQFWNIVVVKQDNDVTRLQALVDKKKVVITEASIREVLRLDDAEGVDCLPNEEIFAELARMGYENHPQSSHSIKPSSQASGKPSIPSPTPPTPPTTTSRSSINISEALDACAALTRRVEHLEYDKLAQALEITKLKRRVKKLEKGNRVKMLKLRRLKRVGTSQRVDTSEDTVMDDASNQGRKIDELHQDDVVALMDDKEEDKKEEEAKVVEDDQAQGRQAESQTEIYKIDLDHASKVQSMQEDEPAEVQEVLDVVTTAKLITKVVTAASETVTTASTIISAAEPQFTAATIIVAPVRVVAASTKRRKGVVIMDPEEESTTSLVIPADTKSKDKVKGIMVEEPKPLKKKQQVEMDEEYARKLHAELNKDIDWDVAIDHVKQKAKEDPSVQRYQVMKKKPQTEAQARKNMIMYLKNTKEQMEEEESRALQSINETPAQKAAKRRKLNEEVEDLKRHLEIIPDEDDDVYTEATPLARKVPVMDYEIINLNSKPYYKIIRADGTH